VVDVTRSFARAAALACLVFAAAVARAEIRVVDDTGAVVVLAAPARRIVSLAPHATELLFAAGAGGQVVGVLKGSDAPPAANALPVIGDVYALDLERIVTLAPDLVVTWPYTTAPQVAALRGRGVAVFSSDPRTIDAIAQDVERLGELAGTAPVAQRAAADFRTRLAGLGAAAKGKPVLRVFYEIWDAPLYTIGGPHLITQALALCGGANVFADLALPAPTVGVEAVLAAKPDVIIAGTDGAARPPWLDAWKRWPQLPAARERHLFVVDANLLHRSGPRFAEGVAQLCAALDRAR
jgi:iron complex transport system substrate-binding protein